MKNWIAFALVAAFVVATPLTTEAAGSKPAQPKKEEAQSPEAKAAEHYNKGLMHRNRAWKMDKKMASASDADKAKMEKKIQNAFKSAVREYEAAIASNPQMHQAYSSMGYALRRGGNYEAALESYNHALKLDPTYTEALEYRAEAYLGMNQPEKAKADYTVLVGKDREHANQLLASMKSWVAARRTSGDVDGSKLDEIEKWIDEEATSLGGLAKLENGKGAW